jgi:DNA ligase 1
MKSFPILYKKTSTGAIQFWEISAMEKQGAMSEEEYAPMHVMIFTKYGQMGTNSPQITIDTIQKGKNLNKKNETTPYEQACKEAESRWKKQKKKGYVESIEAAENEELDELIEGGINPMLAHTFSKHGHKIKYPCYMQPKLDGIRCIAMIKDGECTLWSRTRKPITSMPHIVAQLEACFENMTLTFDGELYNHMFKNNFEHIVSLVRQEEAADNCADVEYHIYDVVEDTAFEMRHAKLMDLLYYFADGFMSIMPVSTIRVNKEEEVLVHYEDLRMKGYEGIMLRNSHGVYEGKRSYNLQKVKEFQDEEFDICGIEEGRGRLSGHVGAFVCRTRDGKEFLAKMSGDTERLRTYFTDHSLWRGKRLTVQFQGFTGKEGVPRFPVGITIRDYE